MKLLLLSLLSSVAFAGLTPFGGTGSVTSVALSLPGILTVSGSPVTTSGTLSASLATQSANLVWAGPTTGSAAGPTFRALVTADMPASVALLASPALTGTPLINGSKASDVPFFRTCSLTSTTAGTISHCLADADIGSGKVAYISDFHAQVNGATAWTGGTLTQCMIQDTNGSPVNFVTIPIADLTGNAYIVANTASVTLGAAFSIGSGGTASKGLDVVCDHNAGAGSNLVFVISGFMK